MDASAVLKQVQASRSLPPLVAAAFRDSCAMET